MSNYFDWYTNRQVDWIVEDRPDLSRIGAFEENLNVDIYFEGGRITGNSSRHSLTVYGAASGRPFPASNELIIKLQLKQGYRRYPVHLSEPVLIRNPLMDRCSLAIRSCAQYLYSNRDESRWNLRIVRMIATMAGLPNATIAQGLINGRVIYCGTYTSRKRDAKEIFILCVRIALDEFFSRGANSLRIEISWASQRINNDSWFPF